MSMKGRTWQSEKYRYGFNGKENDEDGGFQDYGMRVSKEKIGRFMSVDPIAAKFPELSTYQFASNTPIMAIDLDGLEALARVRSEQQTAALKVAFAGAQKTGNYNEALRILHYGQGNVFVDDNKKPSTFVKRTLPNAEVLDDNLPITLSYDKSINGIQVWGFEMVTDKGLPIKGGRFNLIGTIPPPKKDCLICDQIVIIAPWGRGGENQTFDKNKRITVMDLKQKDEDDITMLSDDFLNIDKWGDYIQKAKEWFGGGNPAELNKYDKFVKEQRERGNRVPGYDSKNKSGDSMKVFKGTEQIMVPVPK